LKTVALGNHRVMTVIGFHCSHEQTDPAQLRKDVSPEQVAQSVRVSSDLGRHAQWLHEYIEQGWDELYLHFVGQEQSGFIEAFGAHVLPELSLTAPRPQAAIV
jgi:hypothetical protein